MHVNMRCVHPGQEKSSVSIQFQTIGYICAGISNMDGYKRNAYIISFVC